MKGNIYTLSYAALLGTFCALLLTAVSGFTAPYKAANAEAEEILNILMALKVSFQADTSPGQLVEIFNTNVRRQSRSDQTLYEYCPPDAEGKTQAVAVRFSGPGLWGPIKGFLALEPDMRTIRGVTFYEQEETPGLGGEIVSVGFRRQFEGKRIADEAGKIGIIIKPSGKASAINEVDAITGATMTCDKVEAILNEVITKIIDERTKDG
jgi:Na+-transporting NADH:ubiquinone oxidoreductase subunit C